MNGEKLYDLSLLEGLDDKESLLDVLNLFWKIHPTKSKNCLKWQLQTGMMKYINWLIS